MKWEVVSLGRRKKFPERNNVRYYTLDNRPSYEVGHQYKAGDYDIEIIYINPVWENGEYI